MSKELITQIKKSLGNITRVFFDIDILDESVVVDVKNAPDYEFKVDSVTQKEGKVFLECFPYRPTGGIKPIERIKEYELCEIPLENVLDTHNGPQEILESLKALIQYNSENNLT